MKEPSIWIVNPVHALFPTIDKFPISRPYINIFGEIAWDQHCFGLRTPIRHVVNNNHSSSSSSSDISMTHASETSSVFTHGSTSTT